MSSLKKVVVLIVEGESEERALHQALKKLEKRLDVRFKITEGDIFTDYENSGKNSKDIVGSTVSDFKKELKAKYKINDKNILAIVQLTDTDGVFIEDNRVMIDSSIKEMVYELDKIKVEDERKQKSIIKRNKEKALHLNTLSCTKKICQKPYMIFYFSCNLDHVLYDDVSIPDHEKVSKANSFSERFNSSEKFEKFFNDDAIRVEGDYKKTWEYIKHKNCSLERNTNFHLLIELLKEEVERLN